MKKLGNILSKIILIIFTTYLIVFLAIPKSVLAANSTRVPETSDDPSIREVQIELAEYAKLWVGVTPYVKGGDSLTRGTDSTRFIAKVFEQFGYKLPGSSWSLANKGMTVSLNEIQLGDIIIFTSSSGGGDGGYSGIYVGNGKYVNCRSAKSTPNTQLVSVRGNGGNFHIQRIIGNIEGGNRTPAIYPDGSNVASSEVEDQIRKKFVEDCVNFANNPKHDYFYSLDLELRSKTYPVPPTRENYTYIFDCTSWVSYALHWFLGLDQPSSGFRFFVTPQGLVHDKVNFELGSCPTDQDIRDKVKPGDVLIDRAVGGGVGCHVAIYTGIKEDRQNARC